MRLLTLLTAGSLATAALAFACTTSTTNATADAPDGGDAGASADADASVVDPVDPTFGWSLPTSQLGIADVRYVTVDAILARPDGRIVLVVHGDAKVFVLQVSADGKALDTSFGAGTGMVSFAGEYGFAHPALSSGGKIVLGYGCTVASERSVCIKRLAVDGSDDPGFHVAQLSRFEGGELVVDDRGRIVLASTNVIQPPTGNMKTSPVVARFMADGTVDTSFAGGQASLDFPFEEGFIGQNWTGENSDVVAIVGGRIVVGAAHWRPGGLVSSSSGFVFAMKDDGTIDDSFGAGSGIVWDGGTTPRAVATNGNRPVAAFGETDGTFTMVGDVATTFSASGVPGAMTPFPLPPEPRPNDPMHVNAAARASGATFALVRDHYESDGPSYVVKLKDATWANGGTLTLRSGFGGAAMAAQGSALLVAGIDGASIAIVRLRP